MAVPAVQGDTMIWVLAAAVATQAINMIGSVLLAFIKARWPTSTVATPPGATNGAGGYPVPPAPSVVLPVLTPHVPAAADRAAGP